MGKSTKLISLLLLSFLLLAMISTRVMAGGQFYGNRGSYRGGRPGRSYGPGSLKPFQCAGECNRRCSATQYHKPCIFFCNKCCNKCLCVPPGTYGNKPACGSCYNDWKTKRGGPKCP